jgi:hypothetical protein
LEKLLYNETVRLKFSPGNHCYYANGKVCQGVTSALKELYPQDDLLEWYSSMAANDIVLHLAKPQWEETLKKAFLSIYKGDDPDLSAIPIEDSAVYPVNPVGLLKLYQMGKEAPHKRSQYGKDVGTQVHEAIDRFHRKCPRSIIQLPDEEVIDYTWIEPSGNKDQDKVALKSLTAYLEWFLKSGLEAVESERMLYSIEQNYAGTVDRIYKRPDGGLMLGDFKTSNVSRKCPTGVRESYWSQLGAYMKAYREEFGVQFVDAVIVNSPKNGSLKVIYGSDAGFNPEDLESIFLDDLKALRNHKFLRNAKLKSRIE